MNDPTPQTTTHTLEAAVSALDTRLSDFIAKEEKRKHWKDIIIPLLSLIVALAGVLSASLIQYISLRSQISLKQYEVTFISKQKAYAEVMSAMHAAFFSSAPQSKAEMLQSFDKLTASAFAVQPFLRAAEQATLNDDVQELISLCLTRYKALEAGENDPNSWSEAFIKQKEKVRQQLAKWLFHEIVQ